MTSRPHDHAHEHEHDVQDKSLPTASSPDESTPAEELPSDIHRLRLFLLAHFGDVSIPLMQETEGREDDLLVMRVEVDGTVARVDLMTMVSPPLIPFDRGRDTLILLIP